MLSLTTVRERPKVKIDEHEYELRDWDEMPLEDWARAAPVMGKLAAIAAAGDEQAKDMTADDIKQTALVIDELARFFLPELPAEVFNKLGPQQRAAIVGQAKNGKDADDLLKKRLAARQARKSSSQSSNGSTAGRRKHGKK